MQEGISCFRRDRRHWLQNTAVQPRCVLCFQQVDVLAAPFGTGFVDRKGNEITYFNIHHGIAPSRRTRRNSQGLGILAPDHRTKILF